jgi:hypothetical protein
LTSHINELNQFYHTTLDELDRFYLDALAKERLKCAKP